MNNMHGVTSWSDIFGLLFYSPLPSILLPPSPPYSEMVNKLLLGAAPPNRE